MISNALISQLTADNSVKKKRSAFSSLHVKPPSNRVWWINHNSPLDCKQFLPNHCVYCPRPMHKQHRKQAEQEPREREKKLNHLIIHFTVYKRTTSGACFSWNLNIFMCAFWTFFFSSSPPSPLFLGSFIVQSLFLENFLRSWDHGSTEPTSSLVCLLCSFPLLLLTSSTHCLFFDSDAKSQRLPPPIWSQI